MVRQTDTCLNPKGTTENATAIIWDAGCTKAIQLPAGNQQLPVITMKCKFGQVKMQYPELSSIFLL